MEKDSNQKILAVLKSVLEAFKVQDRINKLQDEKNKVYDDFKGSQIQINLDVLHKLDDILSRLDSLECSK